MQAARGRPGRKSRLAAAASHAAQAGDSSQGTCTDDQQDQELPSGSPSASDVSAAAVVELGAEKQQPEQPGAQNLDGGNEELPHTQEQDHSTATDEQHQQQAAGEAHRGRTCSNLPRKRPAAAAAARAKQLKPQRKRGRKPGQVMPAQQHLSTDTDPALDAAADYHRGQQPRRAKGPRRAAASKLSDRQMSSSSSGRLHLGALQQSYHESDPTAAAQDPAAAVWSGTEMFCSYSGYPGDMSFLERCCTPEQLLWLQQQVWMAQQWLQQQQQQDEAPLATGSGTWQQAQEQNLLPPAMAGHQLPPEGVATMPQQQQMWSSYAQLAPERSQQDWSAAEQQGVQQGSASAGRAATASALLTALNSMQEQQMLQRGNGTAAGAAAGPCLNPQQQQDAACTSSGRLAASAEPQYAAHMAAGQQMRASEHRPVHNSQLQGAILAGGTAFQQQDSSRQQPPCYTNSTPSETTRDMEREGAETWQMLPNQDTSLAYGNGDAPARGSVLHGQDMHTGDPSPADYALHLFEAMAATAQLQRQGSAAGAAASMSSPAAAAAMLPMLPEVVAAGPGPGHPPGLAGAFTTSAAAHCPQQALATTDLQQLASCHSAEMEWLEAFDLSAAGDIPSEEVEELLDSFE